MHQNEHVICNAILHCGKKHVLQYWSEQQLFRARGRFSNFLSDQLEVVKVSPLTSYLLTLFIYQSWITQ